VLAGSHPPARVKRFELLTREEIRELSGGLPRVLASAATRSHDARAEAFERMAREPAALAAERRRHALARVPSVYVCLDCGAQALREVEASWLVVDVVRATGMREHDVLSVLAALIRTPGEEDTAIPPHHFPALLSVLERGGDLAQVRKESAKLVRRDAARLRALVVKHRARYGSRGPLLP
jgi:hypothetical protein